MTCWIWYLCDMPVHIKPIQKRLNFSGHSTIVPDQARTVCMRLQTRFLASWPFNLLALINPGEEISKRNLVNMLLDLKGTNLFTHRNKWTWRNTISLWLHFITSTLSDYNLQSTILVSRPAILTRLVYSLWLGENGVSELQATGLFFISG
jgi:hypothetical protein